MSNGNFELIEKTRAGDQQAFTTLVTEYTPYVYRTAFALLQDQAEAEDVSQEVFLKVYHSIYKLSEVKAFGSWLKKIITNSCLDHLKKARAIPVPDEELELIPARRLDNWDQRLIIQETLKKLPVEYREALIMREWQGYEYSEIAKLLSIPVGTVKSRIHTARLLLRKILTDSVG